MDYKINMLISSKFKANLELASIGRSTGNRFMALGSKLSPLKRAHDKNIVISCISN